MNFRNPSCIKSGHGFVPCPEGSLAIRNVISGALPVKGRSATWRACLMAAATTRWCLAHAPVWRRGDLAFLGNVAAEQVGLLVVNGQLLVRGELTKLGLGEKLALSRAAFAHRVSISLSSAILYSKSTKTETRPPPSDCRRGGYRFPGYGWCWSIRTVAQHHHFIGNDLHAGMLLAFLVIPAAGLQPSFNIDLLAFDEILFADLGQVAPGHDVEPFGLGMAFAVGAIPRTADSHGEGGHRADPMACSAFRDPSRGVQ